LLRRGQRREENAFLLEGSRAIADAIDASASIEELFVADDLADDPLVTSADERGITTHVVGRPIIKAISDSVTPQGIVAVITSPLTSLDSLANVSGLIIILAGVSDPGNVGTLIRTAAAAKADAVIACDGTADPLNPKTARASAGALFTTRLVADVSLPDAVAVVSALGYRVAGAESEASDDIYTVDLVQPTALVLGNESWGLPENERELLDVHISIPMPGSVESLNVATAGSIIIFEALRQRLGSVPATVSSAFKEVSVE
jgi:TrmH family RNA methyltransferase